jgi:hypothetical protein
LVTPVPLSPLLLLCCAYGGGSIKISLQAVPYTHKVSLHGVREINEISADLIHFFPTKIDKNSGILICHPRKD